MDWFKGKPTGNHRFSHEIWCFPVNFPSNQSIETWNHMKPMPMQNLDRWLQAELGNTGARLLMLLSEHPPDVIFAIEGAQTKKK
jgi:hypothetical protein